MKNDGSEFVPETNTRSLVQDLADILDDWLTAFRQGTRYESVRPSDVRVFVLALRQPRSMSELARLLGVSRQSVHMSVKRLMALGIVELKSPAGNHREKLVVITDHGQMARRAAQEQVMQLETQCREVLGEDHYATLRVLIVRLTEGLQQRHLQAEAALVPTGKTGARLRSSE